MKFALTIALILTFSIHTHARSPEIGAKKKAHQEYQQEKNAAREERKAATAKFVEAIKAAKELPPEEKQAALEAARKDKAEALLKFHASMKTAREKLWSTTGHGRSSIAVGEPVKTELDQNKNEIKEVGENEIAASTQGEAPSVEPVMGDAEARAPASAETGINRVNQRESSLASRR